ncbi:MAG: TonB-dependent receptor [Prevotella histicola]|uniref:TonB-dependent receptor n=1 Tax=Prevotella histicola TaxID=470565 RepID=A0A930N4L6_9BACT|nr:TonB-dependent receptor [Prevotella histicola]MBF1414228.1 TonB-dependent receptor [Prevotella histicola]MBF1422086.1 TonB-dependent receptor [Prevotella histicola]
MEKRLMMFLAALFLCVGTALAQTEISGTVISSEDKQPIIGASILVAGTQNGTVTDVDGNFKLSAAAGSKLVVSYIGMNSKTVTAAPNMKITLDPEDKKLDEVVVVAYGTAKRQSLTGSVAVVDSKKISDRINTSVTGALEGSAPGVQVNNSYGEPGQAPKIHIRGVGTLVNGADQPLYIVDGTPYEGNIAELNPNDIESMSVLKDASSAALYGNRAANGVILITTKKAKYASKPNITLKVDHGFYRRGLPEYDRLGPDQWMEASWKAMKNSALSGGIVSTEADAADYATKQLVTDYARRNIYDGASDALFDSNGKLIAKIRPGYDDLDWAKGVERTGHRQEYNLSAAVSGDKFNIYSSAGYLNEQGYIRNSSYERFTGRINTTYNATKWLELGINLSGTSANRNFNPNASGNMFANPFYVTRYMAPIYPVYLHNADGSYLLDADGNKQYDTTSEYLQNRNIVYEMSMDKDKTRRNVLDGLIYAKVTLPYGFTFTGKADLNHANTNRQTYNNPIIGDGSTNNGRLTEYSYQYTSYTGQELLTWEHDFDVHHLDVLLGHENYSWNRRYSMARNVNAAIDGLLALSNFVSNSDTEGFFNDYRTESYLGRLRYSYDDKYFADFSLRRDGSSKFQKDNRWGNFFSFGVNWNIKKENFMKDVKWVDALRARASYGEVGNDAAVDYYGYQALYYITKNGGKPALIRQKLAANNLKWETTQTFDFGVEGTLFDRLNFSLGYFDKRSKDLLFQVRFPLSAGSFSGNSDIENLTQYQNIGTISNRGFEIMLSGDVVRSKDWTWNLSFDATTLKNKVLKLPNGEDILHGHQKYSVGHSAYEWYTYHFAGVDQMTGSSLYDLDTQKESAANAAGALVEINGTKYTTNSAFAQREWAGTALPSVYGSFGSNLRWKDLSLSVLMTYSLGGKIMDASYQSLMSTGSASSAAALHKDILGSWDGVPAGMTATSPNRIDPHGIPIIDFNQSNENNSLSDRWLTSASYLIMKNIMLTYRLPKTLVSSWGLGGVSVKAGVENLFTVTSRKGLNPQYNFKGGSDDTYVSARVFNFGLSVDF